jgi:hypothetical protein
MGLGWYLKERGWVERRIFIHKNLHVIEHQVVFHLSC